MNRKVQFVISMAILLMVGFHVFLTAQDEAELINKPESNFEYLWKTMERDYALFDVKNIDWKLLYKIYRPKVTSETTNEDLFNIMSQMLGHLNDNIPLLNLYPTLTILFNYRRIPQNT